MCKFNETIQNAPANISVEEEDEEEEDEEDEEEEEDITCNRGSAAMRLEILT